MSPYITNKEKLGSLFLAGFIFAISLAQIAYVQSTFLSQFFSLEMVSLIFFGAYAITFILMNQYPNLIAKYNNLNTAIGIFILEIIALLSFIYFEQTIIILIAFLLYILATNLIFINFDIFLEKLTSDKRTGRIRGIYYTIYNLGWVISPFISGEILNAFGFNKLFGFVIFLIIPIILILRIKLFQNKNHFAHKHFKITATIKKIVKNPNLKKIFYLAFLLQVFYATMVIYMPIYLNKTIGLAWNEIGIIFSIMLLPFILIEYPAGYLADKYFGEKEILSIGLIITTIASVLIFLTNSTSILVWALILFFSRIGASLIEIMRDTYFFKKVQVQEIGVINAFRSTMPLAYIFVPLISAIVLYFLPIHYIFLVLALIMLSGLYFAITLKDTK
jgi:MFS family permease